TEALIVPVGRAAVGWIEQAPTSAPALELEFAFFHDRVQQAAHSLSSKGQLAQLHLLLGRSFRAELDAGREQLFATVEHLNQVDPLLSATERAALAELNVRAARLARESIAYRTAAELLIKALRLDTDSPTQNSKLAYEASLLLAENLYLATEFEGAEQAFETALAAARGVDEQVRVQRTRLVLYLHMQRYADAIRLGIEALALLGVRLPIHPSPARLGVSLARTLVVMRGRSAAGLLDRSDSADAQQRSILELLVLAWTPSFWTNQPLNALVVLKLIDMTALLGNTPQAPMAYVCFGILNHLLLKRPTEGLQFSQLAVKLLTPDAAPFIASRVRFLALTFFGALERDNVANVAAYEELLGACLESGEHVFGGHAIDGITTSLPVHGFRIPEIERRLDSYAATAARIGSESSSELIGIIRAWCKALREGASDPTRPLGPLEVRFDSYLGVHGLLSMSVAYLAGDDERVLGLAAGLRKNQVIQSNPLHASLFALFYLLSACRKRQLRARLSVQRALTRVARFEAIFPANFRSMLRLMEAEHALYRNDAQAAVGGYHRALAEASAAGHDLVHAIAAERLATLYDARAERSECVEYMRIASYSYRRFGASAKARQLELAYPALDLDPRKTDELGGTAPAIVDLRAEAVMRAAYAIAEETRSERVAESLLRVIASAAGAQRAFLIKESNEEFQVIAGWEGSLPGEASAGTLSLRCVSESV
ncbi:MAG TPA: hypothetical protein VJU61_20620, partial [Polyangiaceae bacterium]|nr:hypothetical protein [Polyangiaceae bacterium]